MKKAWLIGTVLVIVAVLALLFRKSEPPRLAFARVRRESLVSMLPTNGKVEPLQWESARAEVSGVLAAVPVQEGQKVARGTLLARISQPGSDEDLNSAQARAAQYRSELRTLQGGGKSAEIAELDAAIARAQFDRDQARKDYGSLKRLLDKQAATSVDVELARARLEGSELSIRTLQQRRQALVSPNDITTGRARLAEAEASAGAARAKLGVGIVRSPIAGTVFSLPARPGNYVDTGSLIASIGNLDQLRVKVFVDEPELGRAHIGLPVRITWDGLPGRSWKGSVERMPSEIVPLGSRQVGEVWVTIGNDRHDLIPGTTVNAEIRTEVSNDALTIPKSAVRRDRLPIGTYVLRGGKLAWQPITTGASNVSSTVVRSGLKDDDLVLLPTDVPVKEGDRARAAIQ